MFRLARLALDNLHFHYVILSATGHNIWQKNKGSIWHKGSMFATLYYRGNFPQVVEMTNGGTIEASVQSLKKRRKKELSEDPKKAKSVTYEKQEGPRTGIDLVERLG